MSNSDTMGRRGGDDRPAAGRPASERVVDGVAAAEGVEPAALDSRLYDAVDPEALDRVVESGSPESVVRFEFHGYRVTVRGDGAVTGVDAAE
ncbi:hypothetical protein Hbl1158_02070 [Halobaculum sp. CBA1158]|uniref:HalOD1 output domain-containing protein n=1 Tax=Halobaculum sp. CBA1158 TaxID=2904243 RepID=UPI001F364A39|nr:HalOD1 output domain-containing protein [Halobaculum sp. CBA1158]UIP00180.1 hypothetical protein Hbl1158_02070 [Halobaculum sp. CBA1158]